MRHANSVASHFLQHFQLAFGCPHIKCRTKRSQIMMLEQADLRHLLVEHPRIGEQVMEHASDLLDRAVEELDWLTEEQAAEARDRIRAAIAQVP